MVDLWGVSHTHTHAGLNTPRYDMSSHGHTWSIMSDVVPPCPPCPIMRSGRMSDFPPRCMHMMCNVRACVHMWPSYRQSDAKAAHMSRDYVLTWNTLHSWALSICPDIRTRASRGYVEHAHA